MFGQFSNWVADSASDRYRDPVDEEALSAVDWGAGRLDRPNYDIVNQSVGGNFDE